MISLTIESQQESVALTCKLDTGAENVLPLAKYKMFLTAYDLDSTDIPRHLKPTSARIMAYGGTQIHLYRTCELTISHHNKKEKAIFYVVESDGPVIIGGHHAENLD